MNFKKNLTLLLTVLVLMSVLALPASAAEADPVLNYEITIDGLDTKEAQPGDIVTVTLYLQRTDSNEPYTMYGMQSELRYDSAFFELVEDSIYLYDGVQYSDIAREGTFREFYMNFVSLSGGVIWQARTRVGSFQLRVIGTEGVSIVTNEDYLVSRPDGTGNYECESNTLTVVVSSECTVKFESNGGSKVDSVQAIFGETLERPKDPTREGKVFAGWYKDIHLTQPWDFDKDTVKGNLTLYAKWENGTEVPPATEPPSTTEPSSTTEPTVPTTPGDRPPEFPFFWLWLLMVLTILIIVMLIDYLIKHRWVLYSLKNGDVALSYLEKNHDYRVVVVLYDEDVNGNKVEYHLNKSGMVKAKHRLRFIHGQETTYPIVEIKKGKYKGKLIVTDPNGNVTEEKVRIKVLDRLIRERENK